MNTLQVFENPEFGNIRTIEIDGEIWFVGKDVAVALGYQNPRDALKKHVDVEDKGVSQFATPSGTQDMSIINESGMYSLILSSKLPSAKKFKHWVTSEVLPAIRKNGAYLTPAAEKKLDDLTAAVQLLTEQLDTLRTWEACTITPLTFSSEDAGGYEQAPGLAARRRWLRTVNEKLDLLSNKFNQSHNTTLSQIYRILEEKWGAVLEEERLKVVEQQNINNCSILVAIFYNEALKDGFQKIVDYNLAPENRGW